MHTIFLKLLIPLAIISCVSNHGDREVQESQKKMQELIDIAFQDSSLTYTIPGEGFYVLMQSKSVDSMKLPYSSVILYTFDGDCSGCIAEFILWNINWVNRLDNDSVLVYYIVRTTNKTLLSYYMDESKVRLPVNHAILVDNDGDASKQLTTQLGLDFSKKVILISNRQKRIICGDPFNNEGLYHQYEKLISNK